VNGDWPKSRPGGHITPRSSSSSSKNRVGSVDATYQLQWPWWLLPPTNQPLVVAFRRQCCPREWPEYCRMSIAPTRETEIYRRVVDAVTAQCVLAMRHRGWTRRWRWRWQRRRRPRSQLACSCGVTLIALKFSGVRSTLTRRTFTRYSATFFKVLIRTEHRLSSFRSMTFRLSEPD